MRTKILYEDNEIMVIHKPSGIATHTSRVGQADVVSELKNYLAAKARKEAAEAAGANASGQAISSRGGRDTAGHGGKAKRPGFGQGAPFLGVVHRLDQPVEGLLVFAKTPEATAKLNEQLKEGTLNKEYYAVVCGKPAEDEGQLVDYLLKEDTGSKVVSAGVEGAKKAVLDYYVVDSQNMGVGSVMSVGDEMNKQVPVSLVRVYIFTGRYHQIRCQLSHLGHPLLGDVKYGNDLSMLMSRTLHVSATALCAHHLSLIHPTTGKELSFTVSPENRAFTIFSNYFAENLHTNM